MDGEVTLLQAGGPLLGLRSRFGLAPIPSAGPYQFGGFANLSFLQATAGREALSRESIHQVSRIIGLAEWAASRLLGKNSVSDRNNAFLQWIKSQDQIELASKVLIRAFPEEKDVALGEVISYAGSRTLHYYTGIDRHIITTFANENACLLQVVQGNPRRDVQLRYLIHNLKIARVPDSAQVTKIYDGSELNAGEASIILRIATVLRDDYLIPEVETAFADISHNVFILPKKEGDRLTIYIAKTSSLVTPLLEFYGKAYELFAQFMKDFVRVRVYPTIRDFVPSSTRDGVEALRQILERNRELYRYEEAEIGDFEGVLGEYLKGEKNLSQVLKSARSRIRAQTQTVSQSQVGSVEHEVPGVVDSPILAGDREESGADDVEEFAPSPPIIRDVISSDMKILTTSEKYPQLNWFKMLLGLSDRVMKMEADFFRTPHTTRILWGGHRVVYIFTEASGRLSLYYDIELREPIDQASGGMFRTTTRITRNRIFVPVPDALADEFQISGGPKEFFVRFDVLSDRSA